MMQSLKNRAWPLAGVLAAGLMGGSYAFQHQQSAFIAAQADAAAGGALDPKDFKPFKLIKKEQLTHNTYLLRYEMPDNKTAGLTVASCLVTRAMIPEKEGEAPKAVFRPYTPTSPPDAAGYMDLVVKTYPAGRMSKYMCDQKVGDTLDIKGPFTKIPYQANMKKHIGMVAGGTGITPMLQVADAILSNPADRTQVSLVFANVSEDDIILKPKIDEMAAKHPNFKVHYVVGKAKWGGLLWKGSTGRVNESLLKQHLPPPGADSLVMVCGPPGMMDAVSGNKKSPAEQGPLAGMLKGLGYTESMVFKF